MNDKRDDLRDVGLWYEYPEGIKIETDEGDVVTLTADEARELADDTEVSLEEAGELGTEEAAFISDLREFADEFERLETHGGAE